MKIGTYLIMAVIGSLIGLIGGYLNYSMAETLELALIVVVLLRFNQYMSLFVFYFSKDMRRVEKHLKRQKRPFFKGMVAFLEGNIELYYENFTKVKNRRLRAAGLTSIYLQENKMDEARVTNEKIKHTSLCAYNNALITLKENDCETYDALRTQVSHEILCLLLKAAVAYKKGEEEQGKRFDHLAIEKSRGLQRYLLVKSRVIQQRNPSVKNYLLDI